LKILSTEPDLALLLFGPTGTNRYRICRQECRICGEQSMHTSRIRRAGTR